MTGTWKPDPTSWRTAPRPAGWKHIIRPRILARDHARCTWIEGIEDGGHPLTPGATHHPARCRAVAVDVDHIGDPDDHRDENLRSLCEPHHDHRTALQANTARWTKHRAAQAKRAQPRHPGLRHPA